MPKLGETFENAQESTAGGGEFKRMVPGIYDCMITGIDTEWETRDGLQKAEERQCVRVKLDVAEGEFAGEFSRDYYLDKPWMHSLFMSWTESAMGMLKHTLKALDEANPGFDSRAAFEADKWMLFIGKRCRVLWNGSERTNTRGYVNVYPRPDRIVCADENPKPKVILERGGTKVDWEEYAAVEAVGSAQQQAPAQAYSNDEIPF